MRFHSQDLKLDGRKGWHGRAWLYLGDVTLGLEWHFPTRMCSVQVTFGGEEPPRDVLVSLSIPWLCGFYFSVMGLLPRRWTPGHWAESQSHPGERFWWPVARQVGVSVHDWKIWLSLWENEMEWSRDDPWWWKFNIAPLDVLLGREVSSFESYEAGEVYVDLPEGAYAAEYVLFRHSVRRPRWPWARVVLRAEIRPEVPIPVPGKGENSWDLDDNAIYDLTCMAESGEEAARKLEASVMRDREIYGGGAEWQAGGDPNEFGRPGPGGIMGVKGV